MVDIPKRRNDRWQIMKAIFDATQGGHVMFAAPADLAHLNLSYEELADGLDYLANEGLINVSDIGSPDMLTGEYKASPCYLMTHAGIKEMEKSLDDEPTNHFPPVSIITVHGNAGPIIANSPNARQKVSGAAIDISRISNFIDQLESRIPDLDLSRVESRVLASEIVTIQAQVDSPKPRKQAIRDSLDSIRSVLEGAGENLVAVGLIELLQHIHI